MAEATEKIELQVINQSNGRAMANITRVFDRIHNASLEDELTLVDDAIVINNRILYWFLIRPYSVTGRLVKISIKAKRSMYVLMNTAAATIMQNSQTGVGNWRIIAC